MDIVLIMKSPLTLGHMNMDSYVNQIVDNDDTEGSADSINFD